MLFTLCCLCFAYGLAVGRYHIFPYAVLRDARLAFVALVEASQSPPAAPRAAVTSDDPVFVPTVKSYSPDAGKELLLVSGGAGYLKDHHEAGCLAWLIDRQGTVRHFWKYDPALWDDLQLVTKAPIGSGLPYPVCVHVFDDGGLLASYQAANTYPFAIGLARFDVNSRLLWKKELFAHHWFSVAEDGRIFVPALRIVDAPVPLARTEINLSSETGKINGDLILVLDADGNVLDEISMLDALVESGWAGLLTRTGCPCSPDLTASDPLHLNDAQLAGARGAQAAPWVAPDDLLVSFACINTVGVLDPKARRFKWISTGATIRQHSPRFYEDGVLVLDNLGGDKERGGTQLVKIGLARGQPTVVFPKPGVATPRLCRTETSGHLDLSDDGRRVLMALANAGLVWEIDLRSGEVLWEYLYVHSSDPGSEAKIHTAKYIDPPSFLHPGNQP